MAKSKYRFAYPIYVVYLEGEAVYASEDRDDCEGYIEGLLDDDIDYVEDEFGISEEDNPDAVHVMAGYYGDGASAEIVTIRQDDIDEESEIATTSEGELLLSELQELLDSSMSDD